MIVCATATNRACELCGARSRPVMGALGVCRDCVTARVAAQEWYMTTTSAGATTIHEWMQWWVQSGWGDGVNIGDLSEVNAAFNLAGPKARQVLQTLVDADLSNEAFPYMHLRQVEVAAVPCRLLRIGFTGELS